MTTFLELHTAADGTPILVNPAHIITAQPKYPQYDPKRPADGARLLVGIDGKGEPFQVSVRESYESIRAHLVYTPAGAPEGERRPVGVGR